MKKFLILLDDVWEEIDLRSIGIPLPSVENKSKIVLSTRSLDVCGAMGANKTIEVKSLNKEKSWDLFQNKVGQQTLDADPQIPKLAETVAEKCHGLPLVLITIGASMASKTNPREWKHAISELNKSAAKFPDMEKRVFHLLKFSYDKLPSATDQVCFLFCALYPEDSSIVIEDLIKKWIGAGYIHDFVNFEEAFNMGHSIIGTLKRTCLLENVDDDDESVKMHDVIRELALWITGRDKGKVIVKSGYNSKEFPINDLNPTVLQTISLMDTEITHLEKLPSCPNLSTFFASRNHHLNHINDDFFLSMPNLKFLDLSSNEITKLPTSICELFELEFFNLSFTNITNLPSEMGNLTKLKYLCLFGSEVSIPRGMLMNFSNLEFLELYVLKSDDSSEEFFEFEEFRCLKKLKYLVISISDFKDLERLLSNPHLCNCLRTLGIRNCKEITLPTLSASSSSSSSHLILGRLQKLQILHILNCSEIKEWRFDCITNDDAPEIGLFESLEKMELYNLPKLIISWDARNLHCAHFRKLHFLHLDECHAMVNLTWLLLIPNLQTLRIWNCSSLQDIISSSEESGGGYPSDENTTFSNLKYLWLSNLPNLQSICSHTSALPFPYLETIDVTYCPKLRRLPLDSNSAKNTLKKIQGEAEWWNGLEWENETTITHFATFLVVEWENETTKTHFATFVD